MEDAQIVNQVVKDFDKADNAKSNYTAQWKENYRLYKSKLKEKREGANLFIPYTWATVEQLKARAQQALFSRSPYVGYAGNSQDDVAGAKIMEDLVYYQMKEKIKLPFKFIQALESIFVYGTAIALYQWEYKTKTVKAKQDVINPITGIKENETLVNQEIDIYNDPDIEFIDVDDFFPDPEGWDNNTCGYYATRSWKDTEYLRRKEKDGIYKLPENIENDSGIPPIDFRQEINNKPDVSGERKKAHELISYYTDDYKIVVLNRKHVIEKIENPNFDHEKPFIRIVAFPQQKEFWGEAIVRVLQSLQEELNSTRNQRIDNVSLILNAVWKKRESADIDPKQLKCKPGNVIEVQNMDDIQPLEFPDVTASAYNEEQVIKQDIQFVSAVSEYARGATPQRKETATTVTTIQDAANIVFNYIIMVIEITGLLPIADAIKKLNQQYIDEEKVVRLFDVPAGEWNYKTVTPAEIQGSYDVVSSSPRLESQQTKENKRAQMLELFNMLTTNPLTQQYVNIPEFIRKIMDTYDIKDFEKLIQPMTMIPGQEQPVTAEQLLQSAGGGMVG